MFGGSPFDTLLGSLSDLLGLRLSLPLQSGTNLRGNPDSPNLSLPGKHSDRLLATRPRGPIETVADRTRSPQLATTAHRISDFLETLPALQKVAGHKSARRPERRTGESTRRWPLLDSLPQAKNSGANPLHGTWLV